MTPTNDKKNFLEDNPALQFISQPALTQDQDELNITLKFKKALNQVETRSRRVQVLMKPSLHQKLKILAAENSTSMNDLIHQLLEAVIEANQK